MGSRKNRKPGQKKSHTGRPSGVIVSLAFHAAGFFIAGLFVVFQAVNRAEPEFQPPPAIERPRMKLKKPKVKVKKSSQPKPSSRIVAKVKTKEMPEIQLPDLVGTGEGLLGQGTGDGGQFMDIPDFKTVTLMGSSESIGSDLVGHYYDLKRNRNGSGKPILKDEYIDTIHRFLKSGWQTRIFDKYYRSPTKLYMTTLVVPAVNSSFGPVCFGDDNAEEGAFYLIHYKGKLVHKEGITFRFWAAGDFVCIVRVNGEIVVAGVWDTPSNYFNYINRVVGGLWTPKAPENRRYIFGRHALASVGDWITLEPGQEMDIEILIGDDDAGGETGGVTCAYLAVEEKGVDYPIGNQGGPILPAFKTARISHDMIDAIYPYLPEDEMISLTNGPVFNDFGAHVNPSGGNDSGPAAEPAGKGSRVKMRTWTLKDGRSFEAEVAEGIQEINSVKLQNDEGRKVEVPLDQLSAEDMEYLELSRPPKLDIDILKSFRQVLYSGKLSKWSADVRPPELHASFGVRIKQLSTELYDHELTAELFAIGRQIYADRYILLDREAWTFRLTKENKRRFEAEGEQRVIIRDFLLRDYYDQGGYAQRGEKFHGYIIIVRDERGEIIAHEESSNWLYNNLDNLMTLSRGNYMDQTCTRRYPIRPESIHLLSF